MRQRLSEILQLAGGGVRAKRHILLARAAALPVASLLLVAIAAQVPPPIPKFICAAGGCVEDKLRGLPLAECQLGRGGAPAQNYTCHGGQCVNGSSGVPKAECP